MNHKGRFLIRARIVLPVSAPPIEDGGILVENDKILAVGRYRKLSGLCSSANEYDLGEVICLPGLVNAHCHLQFTHFYSGITDFKNFKEWIESIIELRKNFSLEKYHNSWRDGAQMLVESGTTTVGDVVSDWDLVPAVWQYTPLRGISFLEIIDVRAPKNFVNDYNGIVSKSSIKNQKWSAIPTPHSLYATSYPSLNYCFTISNLFHLPVSIHLAESQEEYEMVKFRNGVLFDWLSDYYEKGNIFGSNSPIKTLLTLNSRIKGTIAVHCNYIEPDEPRLLYENEINVVHCPRSWQYFGHRPFLTSEMLKNSVNICLGTDSLATVKSDSKDDAVLSLFIEMREFAKINPVIPPEQILRMVTINPAKALKMNEKIGRLAPGAYADLIAIKYNGKIEDAYAAVVNHNSKVDLSIIAGEYVYGSLLKDSFSQNV